MNSEADFAAAAEHAATETSQSSPPTANRDGSSADSRTPGSAWTSTSDDGDSRQAAAQFVCRYNCSLRQRRCARRQAGVPVSLLATAALFLVLLGSPALAAAKQCTRYRGAGCHFTVRHEEPVIYPACLSECKFEVEQEMQCPFYSGGLFVTEERSECGDDFMEVAPRQLPDCKGHCCRLQHSTGAFLKKATETQPHQLQFQPGGSGACRFEQYSRAEVLAALQGSGADGAADAHPGMDILVVGDSLMRQLYSRLVHMVRGHSRVVDYKMHTHAAYAVCEEADAFKTAPYNGNRSALAARLDDDYLASIVPGFFQRGSNVEPAPLCSRRPAAINYVHAPTWGDQAAVLQRYWPAVTPGRHPVLVLSVGFWEKAGEVPQEYLEMLTELAQKVERIFFVGLPTRRVVNDEWRSAYRARNAAMAAWAAAAGPRAEFLDFDGLAHTPAGPAAGADGNWHFQCFLQWPSWRNKKLEGPPANYFRDRVYGHPIEGIVVTEDGHCADEMNRNMWSMIFNVLLGDKGVPATPQDVLAADAAAAGSVTDEAAAAGSSRTDARPQDVRRRRRRQLML